MVAAKNMSRNPKYTRRTVKSHFREREERPEYPGVPGP
jgi:hypothetical protein